MGATGTKRTQPIIPNVIPQQPQPAPVVQKAEDLDDTQPVVDATAADASAANDTRFKDTDPADFHQLYGGRQYYQDQHFGIDTQMALQDYLSDTPVPGSMYSVSQNLNYKMEHDQKLSVAEQAIVDDMMAGMHNLGYNLNLTRFGRVDYVDQFGRLAAAAGFGRIINSSNFDSMSEADLQKAFVGLTYSEDKFVSTSYNGFANAPNGGRPFTDKAVKFNYKAPAKTQALMPGNGPGGALGEMVLAPGQNYRITGVRFTGKQGRSGASSYRQIEFDVEIY